mgnify:CR=1 FL=1
MVDEAYVCVNRNPLNLLAKRLEPEIFGFPDGVLEGERNVNKGPVSPRTGGKEVGGRVPPPAAGGFGGFGEIIFVNYL